MISKQCLSLCVVSVLLGVLVDVSGEMMSIQLIPQNPVIGGSVTLSVTGITGNIRYFIWFKGLNTSGNNHTILTYIPGDKSPLSPGPLYNIRMTPHPDGSLQISNLNRMDEGNYTVKVQADNQSDTRVHLNIYESTDPNNDNHSGTLGLTIGIVIAVILLLVLVAALVYLFVVHRRRKKLLKDQNSTIKSQTNPPAAASEPELQYADVVFSKNMPRRQQPPPDVLYANRADLARPQETVYSDLRLN